MTEALQEVPQALPATTETAVLLHQADQVSVPAAAQATAEEVPAEDIAEADPEAAAHPAEEDKDNSKRHTT